VNWITDDLTGLSPRRDANTPFQKAARNFTVPTDALIRSRMSKNTKSTHPYLAAGRHATCAALRSIPEQLGHDQYEPNVSSNTRDDPAHGGRAFNQLKDLGHGPRHIPPRLLKQLGEGASAAIAKSAAAASLERRPDLNYAEDVYAAQLVERLDPEHRHTVISLFDCLAYAGEDGLRRYSGNDMMIWDSQYTDLCGKTAESVYYADSDSTFVEIIGSKRASGIYKQQTAWDFTPSDIVYVENLERSAFTVYNVIKYAQPNLLKQVVFMAALQTVNLPYAVVNEMILLSRGHNLSDIGIGTPHPCRNVITIPADPKVPGTRDILVMSNGTPLEPTASVKYLTETSPDGVATMTTPVYSWIKQLNSGPGRSLTVHEIIKRLELFKREGEFVYVPGAAAYVELVNTAAWWGELPNIVYYDEAIPDELPPEEAPTATAVMAAPLLAIGDLPSVLAHDDGSTAACQAKMKRAANTVEPPAEWRKISGLCVRSWLQSIARETGVKPGSVALVDKEEVLKKRTRPVQVARGVADGLGPSEPEMGQIGQKKEGGHKTPSAPRLVQNPDYDVSIASGVLGKSCEQVLKATGWYNPGDTPMELAEGVRTVYLMCHSHELKAEAGGMRSVDYTAADDSHSKFSNTIMWEFINYFFCKEDVALALAIYSSCFNMEMKLGKAIVNTLWKNASGTGITTLLNTGVFAARELQTTAVAVVFKSMENTGELVADEYIKAKDDSDRPFPAISHKTFLKHIMIAQDTWNWAAIDGAAKDGPKVQLLARAYEWIGPKFGDDGLDPGTPFVSDRIWECAMLYVDRMDGFVRKLEVTSAVREEPVEYLSRNYPCPLRTLASYCKIEKAATKLSVATGRDRERYVLKLRGYATNDRNTPIIGALLTAVAKMYGVELLPITDQATLDSLYQNERELYYKISNGPAPWCDKAPEEVYAAVAAERGMTAGELEVFDAKLRSLSKWDDIQQMMIPAGLMKYTPIDPLAQFNKPDPAGVARTPAFTATTRNEDVRMENFPSVEGKSRGKRPIRNAALNKFFESAIDA
jgi:hypothetical protein